MYKISLKCFQLQNKTKQNKLKQKQLSHLIVFLFVCYYYFFFLHSVRRLEEGSPYQGLLLKFNAFGIRAILIVLLYCL